MNELHTVVINRGQEHIFVNYMQLQKLFFKCAQHLVIEHV